MTIGCGLMIEQIHAILHGEKRGNSQDFHADCPFCGKEAKRRQTHFSYCEDGFICFVCEARGSLRALAEHLRLDTSDYQPPAPKSRKRKPRVGRVYPRSLVERYQTDPRRFQYWEEYRGLNAETVERYGLGMGQLPGGHHTRLIVPVVYAGRCWGLRGRALNPHDKPKWMNAKGSISRFYAPGLRRKSTLWLLENCADVLLLKQMYPEYDAGAPTTGAGAWLDEWTIALQSFNPELVIVAYDNDEAGQRAATKRLDEFKRAGICAVRFEWSDGDTDMGDLLMKGGF